MIKKITSVLICIIILVSAFTINTFAVKNVQIEQVTPMMPKITAVVRPELNTNESIDKSDCFAKFGAYGLDITNLEKFDSNKHETTVYFIVDISGSMNRSLFNEAKRKLLNYSNSLPSKEKMVLISFGNKVNVLLNGDENKDVRNQKINSLTANESQTNLFNAIKTAVDMSHSDTMSTSDRSYAVVISDGDNFENGGGNTQKEVNEAVSGHGLPIYALCLGGTNANASAFGELSRSSGGEIYTSFSTSEVSSDFDKLNSKAKNVYILSMLMQENIATDGQKRSLMIRIGEKSADVEAKTTRWHRDDSAPRITRINSVKEKGKVLLYVYYDENVLNADKPENFTLKRGKSEIKFSKAEYVFTENDYYTILTPKKEPSKHNDYYMLMTNVTDSANELNQMDSDNLKFEVGVRSGLFIAVANYWWVLVILIVVAAGVVFLVLTFKNKEKNQNSDMNMNNFDYQPPMPAGDMGYMPPYDNGYPPQVDNYDYMAPNVVEKHHIVTPHGKDITFKINDGKSTIRTVRTSVVNKLTIGRSDKCNIYLDDLKMSRLHFEIELINNEFWIHDLNSANGTFLNGVRISQKRRINRNDIIKAGQSEFTVIF